MATLKNVLEGKPLRCPVHPALVHLPIALFPISLLLNVASWMLPCDYLYLVRGAFVALLGGIATGLLAAVFGLIDYTDIRADHRANKIARRHMLLNVVAIALFAISAVLRHSALDATRAAALPFGVSLVGVVLLSYSGYLGGHLVYSDGIAVGRHRRKTPTPHATLNVSSTSQQMIPVAHANQLGEGQTLRVDLGGTIIVIARVGGQLYAFQEFCTHRYGPLSAGALAGHEVTCPWHCSKFDMRTGQVTAGPAKVDLRTFRVETKEGRIWVESPVKSADA